LGKIVNSRLITHLKRVADNVVAAAAAVATNSKQQQQNTGPQSKIT